MATLIRSAFFLVLSEMLFAQALEQTAPDSLVSDTVSVVQSADTIGLSSQNALTTWILPVAIVGATAGLFILLFTTRSR